MISNFGSAQKPNKAAAASARKKNVQVVVRTRPMSENERAIKNKNVVECDTVSKVINLKNSQTTSRHGQENRAFGPFDKVFGTEATQLQLYNEVVGPLMKEVQNGYNCTVFAYGQTGSGKTYTMEGRHDESGEHSWQSDPTAGIIPRALHQIFTELGNDDIDFTVRASYVELYNENIYDLLSQSETSQIESLRIFDDKTKGVSIAGAEEVIVRTRDEVYELLRRGAEKRRTAATLMNISSSRSHSVFTVSVMIRETELVNGEELLRQGKLNLVDLAGSENIGRSGATDKRAREAGNINTSLLALGRVINALTMNAPHIPYRESKLTRILQDSLGGKTITTIIATISPASSNFEESVNTLEYAQRAKNIKNNPEVNQKITRRGLLKEYNEEIERLRRDLLAAREKHGIYLDKENYDTMVETIEEKSTKVEELEGQLVGQLQRVKILIEDFEIMDQHYQTVYDKCNAVLNKLAKRKVEVEKLNKDLAQTKDNLKAANKALSLSENSFVRLRAQAYKFQNSCANYYQDLNVLHDKLDSVSQMFARNDELLDSFADEQTTRINAGRQQLLEFSKLSSDRTDQGQKSIDEIRAHSAEHTNRALAAFTDFDKHASSSKTLADTTLADFVSQSTDTNDKFMEVAKAMMNATLLSNEQMCAKLASALELIAQLEQMGKVHREQIDKLVSESEDAAKQDEKELEEFVDRQRASINKRRNQLSSTKRTTGELEENITAKTSQLNKLQRKQQENVQTSNRNMIDYETACKNHATKTTGRIDEFSEKIDSNIGELVSTCHEITKKQAAETKNNDEFVQKAAGGIEFILNEQKDATAHLVSSLSSTLTESADQLAHFVEQDFIRIQPTGTTPNRRQTNSFLEDLIDLPPAQKLLEEQRQLVTPRRTSFFRSRDSILDSSDFGSALLSPNTLKSNLQGCPKIEPKLECVEEEKNSRHGSSSSVSGKSAAESKP